jgi:hypothetical protein
MRKCTVAAWLMVAIFSAGGAAAADASRIQHRATEFDRVGKIRLVHASMPKAGSGAAKAEPNLSPAELSARKAEFARRLFWAMVSMR